MQRQSPKKPSPVETAKIQSQHLRGTLPEELAESTDSFTKDNVQVLKHHGIYQQDDRDARAQMREAGKSKGKQYIFMVRTRVPGGKLTSDQLLAELDLCDEVGNATLRVTTRQGLQLHGIVKSGLKRAIKRINEVQLSTLAACGDVERNVMCTPAPLKNDPVHTQMQALADQIAAHLAPRTKAYHEVWVRDPDTGEKELVGGGRPAEDEEVEPIYGRTYLPRKFKTGIGLPGDNSIDLYAQDIGLMALCEDFQIVGYNVLVGGSFGVTPSAEKTYQAIAKPMAFVRPEQVLDVATAIVKVQRDYGNRQDRKLARMKYTIAEMGGIEPFKAKVEEYYGGPLEPARPVQVFGYDDCLGWREQGDGKWFYGLNIENGRIQDTDAMQLKTAIRQICHTLRPAIRLTPAQSILFTEMAPEDRVTLDEILHRHGVKRSEEVSTIRRWSMACPALPTCGLAVAESERVLPSLMDQLEVELEKLGLDNERITVRMTGCPNGCARPYTSDIGLVGRTKGKYTIFVGGRLLGDRLNFVYRDLIPTEEVVAAILPLLVYFKQARLPEESFGDFCFRKGNDDLLAWTESFCQVKA